MIKINPITVAEPDTHEEILSRRQTPITAPPVLAALALRFQEYDNGCPALLEPTALSPVLQPYKSDLLSLYVSNIVPAKALRKSIRDLPLTRCPYCGRHGKPKTLDHFLPKDDYPEFSLYYKNLIPCCWTCNHAKRKQLWDETTGARLFLNPYFDSLLSEPFVQVTIYPDPGSGSFEVPLFHFSFSQQVITALEQQICMSHFDLLQFKPDMAAWFAEKLRVTRRSYFRRVSRGRLAITDLEDDLDDDISDAVQEGGVNSWEAIFYRALRSNAPLIAYIVANPLRPSPAIGI